MCIYIYICISIVSYLFVCVFVFMFVYTSAHIEYHMFRPILRNEPGLRRRKLQDDKAHEALGVYQALPHPTHPAPQAPFGYKNQGVGQG